MFEDGQDLAEEITCLAVSSKSDVSFGQAEPGHRHLQIVGVSQQQPEIQCFGKMS